MEKIASIGIINEKFAEENKDTQGLLGFNACGTGAYSMAEAVPDVSVTLEAYTGYWGGEPSIKTLHFELITDDTTSITAFEAGELDVMGVPSANWEEIVSNDAFATSARPSNHVVYLIFNPEKAKELLAQAGYPDGLDIGSIKTLGGSYFEKVVQVVQAELAEVGITCTIESMDGNSLVNDCITGNFTMADMGQNLSLDYDFLKTYFNEEYIDGLNMARYSDSTIQDLFEKGASTTDKEERLAIYKEIEDLTQEVCAYVPLYNLQTTTAWNKDLNYTPSITGVLYKDFSWK